MISVSLSGTGKQQQGERGAAWQLWPLSGIIFLLAVRATVVVVAVACVCSRAQKGKTAQKLAATFDQDGAGHAANL